MQIILLLIIVSLIVAVGFLFAFFWAVRDGQYEDDFTPGMRPLIEEDMQPIQHKKPPLHHPLTNPSSNGENREL